MVDLNCLSKVGYGCYRVSVESRENYDALLLALRNGCNLIDTSSNYMNGLSERLIGKVLTENQDLNAFVITKAGYIQNENLNSFKKNYCLNITEENIISIEDNFKYCIHPVFLKDQIEKSLNNLGINMIDGFLLHNPEYLINNGMYKKIKLAFGFLERMVSEKKIRYYGISSNLLSCSEKNTTVSIKRLIEIANTISSSNHFKLIQFPHNLIEKKALEKNIEGNSIIDIAKKNKIKMFSNRPLNANSVDGCVRLVTYNLENIQNEKRCLESSLKLLKKQLEQEYLKIDLTNIEIINFITKNWNKFENNEYVDEFFDNFFYPFLLKVYKNNIPKMHLKVYSEFRAISQKRALKNMSMKAENLQSDLVKKGLISKEKKPLQFIAIESYFNDGIDHVLIGMRKTKYVEDFNFFIAK